MLSYNFRNAMNSIFNRKKTSSALRPDSLLDAMRSSGDDPADALLSQLLASGEVTQANSILAQLVRNGGSASEDFPPLLKDFLISTGSLPDWADKERIERAQTLFTGQGAFFGLVLMAESLPILYAGGRGGAQILYGTGQLSGHFRRRASETLRFILDAMEPGGLEPGGKGLRAIQKVRLMHAAIRHYGEHSPLWKGRKQDWGRPINQEELAGTLLAFSSVALDGMRKLDIGIGAEDEECYLHTWKVIGHVLGIRAEMLPRDMPDARGLWKQIDRRNFMRTKEGCALAADHLVFLREMVGEDLLRNLPVDLMHMLMGDRVAHRLLGLPRPGWAYFIVKWLRALLFLEGKIVLSSATLRKIASVAGRRLMEFLYRYWNEGKGTAFKIPEGLTRR
jgi:hypothetical protein